MGSGDLQVWVWRLIARLGRRAIYTVLFLALTLPALGGEPPQEEPAPSPGASDQAPEEEPGVPEEADPFDLGARLLPRPIREMRIGGVLQGDFADGSLRASSPTSDLPIRNGIGSWPVDSRLLIRRARMEFSLPLGTDATVKVTLPFEDGGGADPLDAFLQVNLPEKFTLLAGRYKVHWGYEGMRGSWNTNTIERSDATVGLYQFRDTGLTVHYGDSESRFRADAGVFLGEGQNNRDVKGPQDVVYRFSWQPTPEWVVDFSGQYGTHDTDVDDAANPRVIPVRRHNLGARYYSGPWTVEGELMTSRGYNFTSKADTSAWGGYISGVRRLSDSLDAVLEYDWFDPDSGACDATSPNGRINARNRTVLGLISIWTARATNGSW